MLLIVLLVTSGVTAGVEEPAHLVTNEVVAELTDAGLPPEMHSDAGLDEHFEPTLDAGLAHDGTTSLDAGTEIIFTEQPAIIDRPGSVQLRLRLGFINEWANHPSAPLGLTLGFRFGGRIWSALVEAWGLMPTSIGNDVGSISVSSFGGITGVCYEHPVLSGSLNGCALGRAGVMRFEPHNVSDLQAAWQPLLAAGLRVGGEWPRESFLAFYVSLQGFVPILRGSLVGANIGWTQKWFFGGAQVGIRLRLE